jgi:tellurite resistance protein TehA-like permease
MNGTGRRLGRLVLGAAETLFPGYFALVMATGITSIASHLLGLEAVAEALVGVNLLAFAALSTLTLLRAARYPERLLADFADHVRGPGFFTAVAGTCVVGGQLLVVEGAVRVAGFLWDVGFGLWLVVMYGFFLAVIAKKRKPALGDGLNGSWLIAAVATQSVSVLASLLAPTSAQPEPRLFAALSLYLLGGFLYLVLITLIVHRLAFLALPAEALTPPYWINMGAVAITTVAGSLLVLHAGEWRLLAELRPFIAGLTLLFWAAASWWIPLLVGLSLWRHVFERQPLRYDPQLWAMAFPLGMYTVATHRISTALDLPFLDAIPAVSIYVALAVWAALDLPFLDAIPAVSIYIALAVWLALAAGLAVALWRRAADALMHASA